MTSPPLVLAPPEKLARLAEAAGSAGRPAQPLHPGLDGGLAAGHPAGATRRGVADPGGGRLRGSGTSAPGPAHRERARPQQERGTTPGQVRHSAAPPDERRIHPYRDGRGLAGMCRAAGLPVGSASPPETTAIPGSQAAAAGLRACRGLIDRAACAGRACGRLLAAGGVGDPGQMRDRSFGPSHLTTCRPTDRHPRHPGGAKIGDENRAHWGQFR